MHIHLVGADLEENLALGILAAVAERQGHGATVLCFNDDSDRAAVVGAVTRAQPELVGLSVQFQHRSREFLNLARALRQAGYRGHVTAGGQFPTRAYREVLEGGHGVDSVVLYDGEETLAELLAALDRGSALGEVPGLALCGGDGRAWRTPARALVRDLDAVPHAKRYRPHSRHVGVPFIPITGGRGCWGRCTYCSISAVYRDAREHGPARLLRLRSPESLAEEMAALWHAAGGKAIFCFHDENLLLPRPE
ncbi:MAG: cobalamin B12-binding domain-containing protein [Deltaproteobacteria bacterium]|nr:cobalamin B12-binding domain-containing protein [Deltaproteobacteria bacterium]